MVTAEEFLRADLVAQQLKFYEYFIDRVRRKQEKKSFIFEFP